MSKEYLAFLEELKGYLVADMEVGQPKPVEDKSYGAVRVYEGIKVKIKVNNTTPDNADGPKVVFLGVGLNVANLKTEDRNCPEWARQLVRHKTEVQSAQPGSEPIWQLISLTSGQSEYHMFASDEQRHGDILFPGESITYELSVPSSDIPYVEFRVEGTVSRRHLFHYQRVLKMPAEYIRPLLIAALRTFNAVDLHRTLELLVKSMPSFGSDTRLVDLQAYASVIDKYSPQQAEGTTLNVLSELFREGPNPRIRAQIGAALGYFKSLGIACEHMKQAISSNNLEKMVAASRDIKATEAELTRIHRAIEEVMHTYNISDEEVNYRYR